MNDIRKLRKAMEKELTPSRFEHTLGVAYTAAALAMCHHADAEKALIAGMLHDCAKCISDDKRIQICEKAGASISDIEYRNPSLLHAKAGSILAKGKYDIEDEDILNAISYHTTGRPKMSLLEKIIFIADYIEPGRDQAKNLSTIREMAFRDLEAALLKILSDTLVHLKQSGKDTDPMTQKTYDYYVKGENHD